ncbi:MAG: sigma-70 family RNA polymerase sigma factor [Acidobacteriaceae bacterium]|jgi:RNA polymerase sigma-70 factor (ECF subfamily)
MSSPTLQSLLDRRERFLAFVQSRVHDHAFAEDILQVAYIRALQKSGTLREHESAVAWFYSVLRNAVIDHYRHRTSEAAAMDRWVSELGLSGPNAEPSTADIPARTLVCGCIQHVLPNLRPSYAEILREVDLADASLADFARRHQLTAGNAAVRAHRARTALRRELARTCGACSVHACLDCVCKTRPVIE